MANAVRFDDLRSGADAVGGTERIRILGDSRLIEIYNVGDPDQANFEKMRLQWQSNVGILGISRGGTGVTRLLRLSTPDGSGMDFSDSGRALFNGSAGGVWGSSTADTVGLFLAGRLTSNNLANIEFQNSTFGSPFSAAAGEQQHVNMPCTINQSGTASFVGLKVNLTETSVGSGVRKIIDAQLGSTSRFAVHAVGAAGAGFNVSIGNTVAFGSGVGVVAVANAGTVPTTNPASGGVLYAEAGAGKWRGSGGTVTTFGPAEPHCPDCGRDCAHEWVNDEWELALCMWCITDKLGMSVGQVGGGVIRKLKKVA